MTLKTDPSHSLGEIIEVDHETKTAKVETWAGEGDADDIDRISPKNPRFTQLTEVQRMKLEKAVQHRLTNPVRLSSIDPSKIKIDKAMSGVWGFQSDKTENVSSYDCNVYNISGVELLQRNRGEHCEGLAPKDVVAGPSRSDSRNEMWGSVFGIQKGQKITDEQTCERVEAYNPGNKLDRFDS